MCGYGNPTVSIFLAENSRPQTFFSLLKKNQTADLRFLKLQYLSLSLICCLPPCLSSLSSYKPNFYTRAYTRAPPRLRVLLQVWFRYPKLGLINQIARHRGPWRNWPIREREALFANMTPCFSFRSFRSQLPSSLSIGKQLVKNILPSCEDIGRDCD